MRAPIQVRDSGVPGIGGSADLEIVCRFLPEIAHNFILDDLSFIEGAQSRAFDRGNMDEYVLAAALRLNESVPLGSD